MRKRCLPRSLHAALCVSAMVLILGFVRTFCGPFAALSPEKALRRQERQSLLPPGEIEARWDVNQATYLADRQPGGEWRVYYFWPENTLFLYGLGKQHREITLLRFYRNRAFHLAGSSETVPWKGTSFLTGGFTSGYNADVSNLRSGSVSEAHLLFENEDPDVRKAEFRCTTVSKAESGSLTFQWTASAERLTPRLFDLTLNTVSGDRDRIPREKWYAMVAIARGGRSVPAGSPVSLEGEVIWQDGEGRELYREKIGFFTEDGEAGS